MVTPLAFQTTIPSRPPPLLVSCSVAFDGHGWRADPSLPSMITLFRLWPRTWIPGVPIQTPAVGHMALFSWYTQGQISTQSPGRAAATAAWTLRKTGTPRGHGAVLPLQTNSARGPCWPAAGAALAAARAWP